MNPLVSFDRQKALQSAQKYLAKGQLDRAISEYERLVQADPKDARLLLKLGDLYTRQGASRDAAATYRKVAEQYAEQGFFLKAVAVCKQILKLDPGQLDVWERLAEMYEMLSLVSDAISTYEQVAEAHTRANNPRKAVRALEKIAQLDPENVAARIRYAEALSKLNRPDEAAAAFREGAELLKKQGRLDDYLKVGERLLFHQPENYDFARELASMYLERGDAKHALARLQACFNADPRNLDTLLLLARAFELLGQTQKTVSVLKEVARLHAIETRRTEQASVLRRILALDPADNEARRELSQLKRLPSEESSAAIEVSEEDYDMVVEDDELPAARLQPLAAEGELDDAAKSKVRRLLDECAVFIRYGLTDKMISQLQEVLAIDPRHVDAREKLKDAFLKARRPADASMQLVLLADIVSAREPSRAESYLSEAIRLDPQNNLAKERLAALGERLGDAEAEDEDVIYVEEATTGTLPVEHQTERMEQPAERPEESFASVMPGNSLQPAAQAADDDELDLVVEEGSVVERLDDDAFEQADEVVIEAEGAEELEDDVVVVDDAQELEEEAPSALRVAPEPQPEAAEEEIPDELREAVEEIEFYLKQGMADEAQSTLADALESFPDHPLLLVQQRAVEAAAAGEAEPAPPPKAATPAPQPKAAAMQDRSFELAQKLAEEVAHTTSTGGSGPVDVADVLAQFKRGVAKQVDKGDSATHYDLGIAYMEMGLHGEAIDEFKLCLDDPQRLCTAHTMIGLSYVAKGDMDLGIEHFRHALGADPKPEEELGLWFELGNAFELLGKNVEALVWYEKVEERDAHFRDVAARIERLGTSRTPEQEADEFDEMFDNMILKE